MEGTAASQSKTPPYALWEWGLLLLAALWMLAFGLSNLDLPSLWHDELVHVFVAENFAQGQGLTLPSGTFYPSSSAYNLLLAIFVKILGTGEFTVRLPSVLLGVINGILVYALARRLLGRGTALVALALFCLSPWQLAWARQARMYELQMLAYLVTLLATWNVWNTEDSRKRMRWAALAIFAYVLGVLCSYHSILALGTVGGLALLMLLKERNFKTQYGITVGICLILGISTLFLLLYNPNSADQSAVFETGIGGRLLDPQRIVRNYYVQWLIDNHSLGIMILAIIGTIVMLWKEGHRGWLVILGFWVPVAILTLFIGYRRPRFMFFAFPLYCILASYGLLMLGHWALKVRQQSWKYVPVTLFVLAFAFRLGISCTALFGDCLETASGSSLTLARRIPQWREPCTWVKETATREDSILTTTYLPVLYYTGRVDNWFPNRYQLWEKQESGLTGLGTLEELQDFVKSNPQGYFIAESRRFEYWRHYGGISEDLNAELQWVEANMKKLPEASSDDVTVYRWAPPATSGDNAP